jgi:hypothetical protein
MRIRHLKPETTDGGMPKLVRVIQQLDALKKQGLTGAQLDKEFDALARDQGEVLLAILSVWEMQRLAGLVEFTTMRAQAIEEAAKRTDLTISEGVRLYVAVCEDLNKAKERIRRKQQKTPRTHN